MMDLFYLNTGKFYKNLIFKKYNGRTQYSLFGLIRVEYNGKCQLVETKFQYFK